VAARALERSDRLFGVRRSTAAWVRSAGSL